MKITSKNLKFAEMDIILAYFLSLRIFHDLKSKYLFRFVDGMTMYMNVITNYAVLIFFKIYKY